MTFKLASNLAAKQFPLPAREDNPVYVDFVSVIGGYKELKPPVNVNEINCPICGCENYYVLRVKADGSDNRRIRFCVDINCPTYNKNNIPRNMMVSRPQERAVEWNKFCEYNLLGDIYSDVTFESIAQSPGKIDYMRKFCATPRGIIFMQGSPGTGKTYSCVAMCELFTRTNSSITFRTQKQLLNEWLQTFKDDNTNYFVSKLNEVSILIVDDFGTGDVSPAFLSFFMDVTNTRMQWKNKGTVVTTNLKELELSKLCGDALTDRLKTGQIMMFEEKESRRKKLIL